MQKINLKTYFTFIILLSFCISAQSEKKGNENPRLVVGIVVDQMKYEYIPKFWNKYGNNGFKRLVSQGFNAKNAHYSYAVTSTAPGHATVVTGTTPNYHGIVGNEWFNPSLNKEIYCVDDFYKSQLELCQMRVKNPLGACKQPQYRMRIEYHQTLKQKHLVLL